MSSTHDPRQVLVASSILLHAAVRAGVWTPHYIRVWFGHNLHFKMALTLFNTIMPTKNTIVENKSSQAQPRYVLDVGPVCLAFMDDSRLPAIYARSDEAS